MIHFSDPSSHSAQNSEVQRRYVHGYVLQPLHLAAIVNTARGSPYLKKRSYAPIDVKFAHAMLF
jgi:hypothetical protein